jgi:DNA-binding MarR family transcriptional regulator
MTAKKLENMFLHSKPVNILVSMRNGKKYASILSKEVDCTYSHTVRILQQMNKFGLVNFEKKGRIKLVELTSHGEEVARNLDQLKKSFQKLEK